MSNTISISIGIKSHLLEEGCQNVIDYFLERYEVISINHYGRQLDKKDNILEVVTDVLKSKERLTIEFLYQFNPQKKFLLTLELFGLKFEYGIKFFSRSSIVISTNYQFLHGIVRSKSKRSEIGFFRRSEIDFFRLFFEEIILKQDYSDYIDHATLYTEYDWSAFFPGIATYHSHANEFALDFIRILLDYDHGIWIPATWSYNLRQILISGDLDLVVSSLLSLRCPFYPGKLINLNKRHWRYSIERKSFLDRLKMDIIIGFLGLTDIKTQELIFDAKEKENFSADILFSDSETLAMFSGRENDLFKAYRDFYDLCLAK